MGLRQIKKKNRKVSSRLMYFYILNKISFDINIIYIHTYMIITTLQSGLLT